MCNYFCNIAYNIPISNHIAHIAHIPMLADIAQYCSQCWNVLVLVSRWSSHWTQDFRSSRSKAAVANRASRWLSGPAVAEELQEYPTNADIMLSERHCWPANGPWAGRRNLNALARQPWPVLAGRRLQFSLPLALRTSDSVTWLVTSSFGSCSHCAAGAAALAGATSAGSGPFTRHESKPTRTILRLCYWVLRMPTPSSRLWIQWKTRTTLPGLPRISLWSGTEIAPRVWGVLPPQETMAMTKLLRKGWGREVQMMQVASLCRIWINKPLQPDFETDQDSQT